MDDTAKIWVEGGAGGNGCISFRREAHVIYDDGSNPPIHVSGQALQSIARPEALLATTTQLTRFSLKSIPYYFRNSGTCSKHRCGR